MPRIAPGVIPIKSQNPYETIRALSSNDEDIAENDIVAVTGYTGDVMVVSKADATKPEFEQAAMFIARTGATAGRALWIQPWRVCVEIDTNENSKHTPVFLGENGKYVFTLPSNGTMWYKRRIGTVIDDSVIYFHLG
jgi:hypothetical protein